MPPVADTGFDTRLVFFAGNNGIGGNTFGIERINRQTGDSEVLMRDGGERFGITPDRYDCYIADPSEFFQDPKRRVVGWVNSHGHQDHVGAFSHWLKNAKEWGLDRPGQPFRDIPWYGGDYSAGIIANQVMRNKVPADARQTNVHEIVTDPENMKHRRDSKGHDAHLIAYDEAAGSFDKFDIGSFEVEFIPVEHSIPGAFSLVVRTPELEILDCGDFKVDETDVFSHPDSRKRLTGWGAAEPDRPRVALIESTNMAKPAKSPVPVIERDVRAGQAAAIGEDPDKRVVVGIMSRDIGRITSVAAGAVLNRRDWLVLHGTSLIDNIATLGEKGYDFRQLIAKALEKDGITLDEGQQRTLDQLKIVDSKCVRENPDGSFSYAPPERARFGLPDARIAAATFQRSQSVWPTTGTQDVVMGKLGTMQLSPEGDRVIVAQSIIPGNQENAAELERAVTSQGVAFERAETSAHEIYNSGHHRIGGKRHASAEELAEAEAYKAEHGHYRGQTNEMVEMIDPNRTLPFLMIHGDAEQRAGMARALAETGRHSTVDVENGGVIGLDRTGALTQTDAVPISFIGVKNITVEVKPGVMVPLDTLYFPDIEEMAPVAPDHQAEIDAAHKAAEQEVANRGARGARSGGRKHGKDNRHGQQHGKGRKQGAGRSPAHA